MSDLLRPNLSPISCIKRNLTAIYIYFCNSVFNKQAWEFSLTKCKNMRPSVSCVLTRLLDSNVLLFSLIKRVWAFSKCLSCLVLYMTLCVIWMRTFVKYWLPLHCSADLLLAFTKNLQVTPNRDIIINLTSATFNTYIYFLRVTVIFRIKLQPLATKLFKAAELLRFQIWWCSLNTNRMNHF